MTLKIDNPAVPNLPIAPKDYSADYQDQFLNVLRLYFNRLENVTRSLLGPDGGKFISLPFGAFYDTTDQTAASTTVAYPITLNSTTLSSGVSVQNSSQITFEYEGVYNIQFSIQLANNDNATQDIDIWFRKNGVDIANSNSRFGLAPRKSAGDPYHVIGSLNFVDSFAANDYVQLYWRSSSTAAYIEHYTAPSSPTRPAIPSVILTATFVSSIPA
jgi:hypothetical protein